MLASRKGTSRLSPPEPDEGGAKRCAARLSPSRLGATTQGRHGIARPGTAQPSMDWPGRARLGKAGSAEHSMSGRSTSERGQVRPSAGSTRPSPARPADRERAAVMRLALVILAPTQPRHSVIAADRLDGASRKFNPLQRTQYPQQHFDPLARSQADKLSDLVAKRTSDDPKRIARPEPPILGRIDRPVTGTRHEIVDESVRDRHGHIPGC